MRGKKGNIEISKYLSIAAIVGASVSPYTNSMTFESLTKSRLSVFEKSSCWLLRTWKRSLEVSMPQHKLRWSDFPDSQEHSGGISSDSKTLWHIRSFTLHLWWRGVKNFISSRNHSPLDCLYMCSRTVFSGSLGSSLPFSKQRRDYTGFYRSFLGQSLWSEHLTAADHFLSFFLRSLLRPGESKESHVVTHLISPKETPGPCWEYQGQTLPPLLTFPMALGW